MFQRLNGRKGLIAIVLMMAVVMVIPFAPQYYTWKVTYDITPLTEDYMSIDIPATSGATSGTFNDTVVPDIVITKSAKVHFRINSTGLDKIDAAFYDLEIKMVNVTTDTVLATLHPEAAGVKKTAPYDVPTATLSPATYDIKAVVTFWTGAVTITKKDSFIIHIYAEEV